MAPFPRFGASKFRNAVPHTPGKEEWYRVSIPPTAEGSTSSLLTFSSEVKTNREWLVTLTPGGDVSYRLFGATGASPNVGTGKIGSGQVGDWDLSRLEDGILAVGCSDGHIQVYRLPASSHASDLLQHMHTIPGSSGITNIALHPTTPHILLASSPAAPLAVYDPSASASDPKITLKVSEPKGLWSVGWSHDGRKVAAIGKSGTAYIFDPRSSTDPISSRQLALQPLKPVRLVWAGDDVFVTAFSKTRNREYHLFSSQNLLTIFTNSLDPSPAPLIPVVDNERKIVYISARGDMSLRQVEVGGATGYQETIHPLPAPLASASLALAWPGTLPVMAAQIATVLIPQVDKDGDAIVPFGIRVPRRQLIDFHDDLYPEIMGSIPEQEAEEWFTGGDKGPLLISLDPSRRVTWERRLEELQQASLSESGVSTQHSKSDSPTQDVPRAQTSASDAAKPDADSTTSQSVLRETANDAQPDHSESSSTAKISMPSSTGASPSGHLPPLEGNETYISTEYKGRIIGHHIGQQLERHRNVGKKGPLMVGLQGPQGCGKTTLCNALLSYLRSPPLSLRIAVLSLDDLYKTNQGLKEVAAQHPDNKLLSGRGPPGTHDHKLAVRVLDEIQNLSEGKTVDLPIFDKSLCNGEGDRSSETIKVAGPLDVFILEGWSMGFGALEESELKRRYDIKTSLSDTSYFLSHPLESLVTINTYLAEFAAQVYPPFSTIIQIEPESYKYVFQWRLEQERNMKASNGDRGMSDEQVHAFVERYMPGYELWKEGVWDEGQPWAGRGLRLWYGKDREVLKVDTPEVKVKSTTDSSKAVSEETKNTRTEITSPVLKESVKEAAPVDAGAKRVPLQTKPAAVATITSSTSTAAKTAQIPTSVSKKVPYNPGWSRKFLAGKSPLIPSFDQIPPLNTLHQDSQILHCTRHLIFFPVQGPGGRIGVHPLSKKGRMPVGGQGYLSGGVEVTDFAVEPFERDAGIRVALAGEDGVVRVWGVGQDGVAGPGPEPELVLKGQGIDKIAQVVFHPTASDLLTLATNESGSSHIRFFDMTTSSEALAVPIETSGIFNIAWSPSGSRVAVATKDGKVLVLDPRNLASTISGKAHDSPRSFQMAWVDDDHLLSVGFSRGSQRRINLYQIGSAIQTIHSLLIDVSPSVLFPVYDPDTSILYVWGKGERQIQAYEVHPDHANEPIAKLPSFTAGNPQLGVAVFPKKYVDVKKVEVAKVLRLTAKTVEDVSFSIPRNKPDFFQDDIYVDTLDDTVPSTTAEAWLKGGNALLQSISLKPEGMTRLSEAPQTTTKAKAKFVPAKDVLSEAEKKKREMDALFAKAKMGDSSDEDDEPKRTGLAPPDDDW